MGFFKSKKGTIISDYFKLLEDVGNLKANNMYEVSLYPEYIEISAPIATVKLKYNQITDVFYGDKEEVVKKERSVIGRAIVGKILFGDTSAIVGAISGIGEKEKIIKHKSFILSYKSSVDDKDYFVNFEDTRIYKGAKIAAKIKELANIKEDVFDNEFL